MNRQPQVPIDVDQETGVWTTDGLPMLYVPRHFFVNNHLAVEKALGRGQYEAVLYPAGYQSAYHWCSKEAARHGLGGVAVFEHYLKRLSQRGWGQFSFRDIVPEDTSATIILEHSAFVLAQPQVQGRMCYMFAGWFAGAMDWLSDEAGRTTRARCRELSCAGESGEHRHCVFEVTPVAVR
ncbi:4-vinyl reductase [Aromatoleum toluvorans]|uniref:4-vinyl reductase n=1 Tax=Aromatoleum toluvorans TaxID=92002 RepID=A0ABX1PXH5_9RHOO|nr:DUF5943 domain-containing protein [Aromatoleum toluvorans]NMG44149.1 4-vinyl reductase [Aromatoleum toluvorans]